MPLSVAALCCADGAGRGQITSALDYDVDRSGRRDSTRALQSAIVDAPFKRVYIPAGRYKVSATDTAAALRVERPGTHLFLHPSARLQLQANDRPNYAILHLLAADCSVWGGTIVGDRARHQDSTGEWGHGVVVDRGADRCTIGSLKVLECWGDGLYVTGGVRDLLVQDCSALRNRRQGISIVFASNPSILRGTFGMSGTAGPGTYPGAGIDIEPNATAGQVVSGASIVGAWVSGNSGSGVIAGGGGLVTDLDIRATTSSSNAGAGFELKGTVVHAKLLDCLADANQSGFRVAPGNSGVEIDRCEATNSSTHGFYVDRPAHIQRAVARGNGASGFVFGPLAGDTVAEGCVADGNSRRGIARPEVDIAGRNLRLDRMRVVVASGSERASYGFLVRPDASASFVDCVVEGSPKVSRWTDRGGESIGMPA